jgi:stearoyl-CoA desaturase (delta-9 desaturase)
MSLSDSAEAPASVGVVRGVIVGGPIVFWKRFESSILFLINVMGAVLAAGWLTSNSPGAVELSFFALSLCVTMLGIGVGVHRHFAHKSFECGPTTRVLLAMAGMMACQGSIVKWVANHRRHHMHSDAPGDPHSPTVDGHGRDLSFARGMLHAHLGFLFDDTMTDFKVFAADLLADPMVMFFHRTRWFWYCASFFFIPALFALAFGGVEHVVGTILVGGILRTFFVLNAIASVGSIGHTFGRVRFAMPHDNSRNNGLLALLTFGEGWHNNHHRHPRAAHVGLAWYEVDVNGAFIHLLARLGLAWSVVPHVGAKHSRERRAAAAE